jgi:AcrR family transcriptional regulator
MPKIINEAEIFEAVIKVIVQRGYQGAPTKEIAEAAGVSEMTLFRKYESKAQLVIQAFTNFQKQIDIEATTQYTGDASADLSRVISLYLSLAKRHGPFIVILFSEFPRHSELAELIDRPWSMVKAVEALISRYQKEGVLRMGPPLQAVIDLIGPVIYSIMVQEAVPSVKLSFMDPADHVDRFLEGYRVISTPA